MRSLNRKLFSGLMIAAASFALALCVGVLWAHDTHDDDDDTGFLGVGLTEETEDPDGGARVTLVVEGSPADEAGIRKDDIIQHIDQRVIRGPNALVDSIRSKEPGDRVTITVLRDGRKEVFDVELGSRSDEVHVYAPRAFDGERWEKWGREMQERIEKEIGDPERWKRYGRAYAFGSWNRPRLGVQLVEVTPELRRHLGAEVDAGVLVAKVLEGMPAETSGILVGDLIVSADGEPIEHTRDLVRALRNAVGETIPVEVYRDGRLQSIDVALPDEEYDDLGYSSPGGRAWVVPRAPKAPLMVLPEIPTIELPSIPVVPLPDLPTIELPPPPAPPSPAFRFRDRSLV